MYAPVAPVRILEQLALHSVLPNYMMIIGTDVHDATVKSYTHLLRSYPNRFVIMDNGVAEPGGRALSFDELQYRAHHLNVDVVVPPDVLGDRARTIDSYKECIDKNVYQRPLMRVIQGNDVDDVMKCINQFNRLNNNYGYWGIPRWITNQFGSRLQFLHEIRNVDPLGKIHLLGMSTNIHDDMLCVVQPNVMGIDSANPMVMARNKTPFSLDMYTHFPRDDYWEDVCLYELSAYNVDKVSRIISQRKDRRNVEEVRVNVLDHVQ